MFKWVIKQKEWRTELFCSCERSILTVTICLITKSLVLSVDNVKLFLSFQLGIQQPHNYLHDSLSTGKNSQLEKHGLCEHIISMRTSYFDIDFVSQMQLTKFPWIHCFVRKWARRVIVFKCENGRMAALCQLRMRKHRASNFIMFSVFVEGILFQIHSKWL